MEGSQNINDLYAALHTHAGSEVDRLSKKSQFGCDSTPTGAGLHLSWEESEFEGKKCWFYSVLGCTMLVVVVPTPSPLFNWHLIEGYEPSRLLVKTGYDTCPKAAQDSLFTAFARWILARSTP